LSEIAAHREKGCFFIVDTADVVIDEMVHQPPFGNIIVWEHLEQIGEKA